MTPSVSFIFMSLECTRRIFGNGILAQRFPRVSRNLDERRFLRGVISLELLLKPMRLGGGKATLALWKTFLWKSLTGLQKCNQESYVAKSCSYFEEGGAASTQFPKQKSWRGKRRTDFSTSGFWRISLTVLMLKAFTMNELPKFVFAKFPNTTQFNSVGAAHQSSKEKAKVVIERNVFSFQICLLLPKLTWPCHALVSVNIKDFFSLLLSGKCESSFSKQVSLGRNFCRKLIGSANYLSFVLCKVCFVSICFCCENFANEKTSHVDLIRHQGGCTLFVFLN